MTNKTEKTDEALLAELTQRVVRATSALRRDAIRDAFGIMSTLDEIKTILQRDGFARHALFTPVVVTMAGLWGSDQTNDMAVAKALMPVLSPVENSWQALLAPKAPHP